MKFNFIIKKYKNTFSVFFISIFFIYIVFSCINTDPQFPTIEDNIDIALSLGEIEYNGDEFIKFIDNQNENDDNGKEDNSKNHLSEMIKTNDNGDIYIEYENELAPISFKDVLKTDKISLNEISQEIGNIEGQNTSKTITASFDEALGDGTQAIIDTASALAASYNMSANNMNETKTLQMDDIKTATFVGGILTITIVNKSIFPLTGLIITLQEADGTQLLTLDDGGAGYTVPAGTDNDGDNAVDTNGQLVIRKSFAGENPPVRIVEDTKANIEMTTGAVNNIPIDTQVKRNNLYAQGIDYQFAITDVLVSEGEFKIPSKTLDSNDSQNINLANDFKKGFLDNAHVVTTIKNEIGLDCDLEVFISNITHKDTGATFKADFVIDANKTKVYNTDIPNDYIIDISKGTYEYSYQLVTADTGNNFVSIVNTDSLSLGVVIEDKNDATAKLNFSSVDILLKDKQNSIKTNVDFPDSIEVLGDTFEAKGSQMNIEIIHPFKGMGTGVKLDVADGDNASLTKSNFTTTGTNTFFFDDIDPLINSTNNSLDISGNFTLGINNINKVSTITTNDTFIVKAKAIVPLDLVIKKDYYNHFSQKQTKVGSFPEQIKSTELVIDIQNDFGVEFLLILFFSRMKDIKDVNANAIPVIGGIEPQVIPKSKNSTLKVVIDKKVLEYMKKDFFLELQLTLKKNEDSRILLSKGKKIVAKISSINKVSLDFSESE